jgi:hypothetical protein
MTVWLAGSVHTAIIDPGLMYVMLNNILTMRLPGSFIAGALQFMIHSFTPP